MTTSIPDFPSGSTSCSGKAAMMLQCVQFAMIGVRKLFCVLFNINNFLTFFSLVQVLVSKFLRASERYLFCIFLESDKNCAKDVPLFKKCAETIFSGLLDSVKTASVNSLPQTNKVAAVQNKKKKGAKTVQRESKAAAHKAVVKNSKKNNN